MCGERDWMFGTCAAPDLHCKAFSASQSWLSQHLASVRLLSDAEVGKITLTMIKGQPIPIAYQPTTLASSHSIILPI